MRDAIQAAAREVEGRAEGRLVAVAWRETSPFAFDRRALHRSTSFAWDARARDAEGDFFVTFGESARVEASGRDRLRVARDEACALFAAMHIVGEARPRLVGGASFEAGSAGPFDAFGELSFALPRWMIAEHGGQIETTLVVTRGELDRVDALAEEHAELLREPPALAGPTPGLCLVDEASDGFEEIVRRAVRAIDAGEVDKVVVSRSSRVEGASSIAWPSVWAALAGQPATTRFAVVRGARTFLGATPERLVSIASGHLDTEALAGTTARTGDDAADGARLLASDKDRREHALVVRAIVEALGPLASELRVVEAPRVRTLAHVHHLVTPISARARAGQHVLDVVHALHPTPAVSGWPRDAAARLLRELEGAPRGWYAAPIGWLDARGDGAFVVGLRSALLDPTGARVYAGAGIVRGSVPSAEWEETRVKQATMLRALGVL